MPRVGHASELVPCTRTFAGKLSPSSPSLALAVWSFYPPQQKVRARPRPQGRRPSRPAGPDRRRAAAAETETTAEQLREALTKRNIPVTNDRRRRADGVHGRGRPAGQDAQFRRSPTSSSSALVQPAAGRRRHLHVSRCGRTSRCTLARRGGDAGAPDDRAPRQRVRRLRADRRAVRQQRRPDPRAAAGRDRRRARQGAHRQTALLELKLVEAGPAPTTRSAAQAATAATSRRTWRCCRATTSAASSARPAPRCSTWCARTPAITGRDLRNARPTLDENNLPAVSFSLNNEGGAQVRPGDRREHRPAALAIVLDGRVQSAPPIEGRITDEGRITGATLHAAGSAGPLARAPVGRAAGVARPISSSARSVRRSAPTRFAPASSPRSSASGWSPSFMLFYYRLAGINAIVSVAMNLVDPARLHGLHRRDDDAAGHCRLHPDDRHRRRLERADLRAHPEELAGGKGARQASRPGSTASS